MGLAQSHQVGERCTGGCTGSWMYRGGGGSSKGRGRAETSRQGPGSDALWWVETPEHGACSEVRDAQTIVRPGCAPRNRGRGWSRGPRPFGCALLSRAGSVTAGTWSAKVRRRWTTGRFTLLWRGCWIYWWEIQTRHPHHPHHLQHLRLHRVHRAVAPVGGTCGGLWVAVWRFGFM